MTRSGSRVLVGRVTTILALAAALSGPTAAQDRARADANQLHAAIANGDVDALKYWLDVRHADPNAPSASEPGVTPIGHCLVIAGRVLDGTPASNASADTPAVGLRVLQDLVTSLNAHGAKLSHAERARFSAPVIRWYDDAIGHPPAAESQSASANPAPTAAPPTSPAPTSAASQTVPVIDIARRETLVVVSPDPKRSCNGSGHVVFLVNHALMPITARVVTHTEKPRDAKPQTRTDTYALEQGATWELGCDTSPGDGRVKYELKDWKY